MASVPDTTGSGTVNDWSLTTVQAAVPGTPTSLAAAIAAAVDGLWDTDYEGNRDELLNFRNYNAPPIPMLMSSAYGTFGQACASTDKPNTVYFLNNDVSDSVSVFTDQSLNTVFTGGASNFFKLYKTDPVVVQVGIQITNLGSLPDPPSICT